MQNAVVCDDVVNTFDSRGVLFFSCRISDTPFFFLLFFFFILSFVRLTHATVHMYAIVDVWVGGWVNLNHFRFDDA